MSERHIFIGDIQGCRSELERLLELVEYDPAADALEPVGDFVNRGPDSLGTLRLLRSLDAGGVLGNHDLHLLRTAAGTRELRGGDTLTPILEADDRDELLAWLAAKPLAKRLAGAWLVHAGFAPQWRDPLERLDGLDPLEPHPDSDFATRVRYCDADGARPRRDVPHPPEPFRPWFEHAPAYDRGAAPVVFGHWAARGLVYEDGLRGLDTGCVWGGHLTGWVAEEDRFVHVPAERAYGARG